MSMSGRGTDVPQHVKGSLQESFSAFLLSKGPPLAPETREDSLHTARLDHRHEGASREDSARLKAKL